MVFLARKIHVARQGQSDRHCQKRDYPSGTLLTKVAHGGNPQDRTFALRDRTFLKAFDQQGYRNVVLLIAKNGDTKLSSVEE